MTNAELNARAAEIMGWREVGISIGITGEKIPHYCGETLEIRKDDWNPAENIAQAFQLVDRIDAGYLISKPHHEIPRGITHDICHSCRLFRHGKPMGSGTGSSLAIAITRACVAAAESKNA